MKIGNPLRALFSTMLGLIGSLLMPSLALADFPPVRNFPNTGFYQARFVADTHDIALMQLTGNYNRDTANGDPNVEPRTVIAKEFYRTHPDHFDFIVVFTNFEFETKDALAFHMGVQNKVKGLGMPTFDNTAQFGSAGKLQGYIDMAALSRYVTNPYDPKFDQVLQVFAHEFLHQWGISVHLRNPDSSLSNALLGKDGAHWSFLLNSGASVEYGNEWRANPDGTFTSGAGRQFFSPLDLYLMGMYRPAEVPPFYLIDNPDIDKTRVPLNDVTISGVRKDLTIDDVIAAEGPRIPAADQAQKEFRIGFVMLSRTGADPTPAELAAVNAIRKAIETRVEVLTAGRALIHSYLESKTSSTSPPDTVPNPRGDGVNLAQGLAWLRGKQQSDGNWVDNSFTSVRDTVVAFDALADLDGVAFTGRQRALDWLSSQRYSNTDYLARRLRTQTRAGQDGSAAMTRLLSLQNADGGWGLAPGYQSTPLDTALALQALQAFESSLPSGKLDAAAALLVARQNADGGWGNQVGGASRMSVSATVLSALSPRTVPATVFARSMRFFVERQHTDGGFGDSVSTVHDTAQVLLALLGKNALGTIRAGDASSYVSAAQHTDGSWDGSVYSTAMALRLLKSAGLFNWIVRDLKATPASLIDGQQALLSFKVANNGTVSAPPGVVRVYDGDPAAAGIQIGQDINVPGLPIGDSTELRLLWQTFDKAGPHQIVALIDPDNKTEEASKADNRAQLNLVVGNAPSAIELQINASDMSVNPARPTRLPASLAISALLSNIGRTDANAVRVVLREGEGASGTIIDEKILNLLGRSQQVVHFNATLTRVGSAAYSVQIDPDGRVPEADKNNNLATVTVSTASALDLEVRADEVSVVRSPVYRGSDAVFTLKLRNTGTQDSPPFKVRYSVANPSAPNDPNSRVEIATRTLQLAAGALTEQEVVWQSTFAGRLEFKVELDPDAILSESDKGNNSATRPFEVIDAVGANLAVSFRDFSFSPLPAEEGKPWQLSQIVRNTGNVAASDIDVAFYDGDPAAGRVIGGMQKIANLAPGAQVVVKSQWTRFPDAQDHLIFFVVDPASKQVEITRDDNSAFQTVTAVGLPDLAVSAADIQFTPAAPRPGEAVTVSVKFSNLGQQSASNVLVRLLDAEPAQGGKPLAPDQTLALVAGQTSQTLEFALAASQNNNLQTLVVVLDPGNAIDEKRKDNNSARRDLVVQTGDFYANNRYFSPNGDGIKDDTTVGFRLSSATDVSVQVVNKTGKVVRTFSNDSLKNTQGGAVRWDGLNDLGSVVNDGDYRLRVLSKNGSVLGEVLVTVDNNRSSIIDAIDTPFAQITNLSCEADEQRWPETMQVTADEERVLFFDGGSGRRPDGKPYARPFNFFSETISGSNVTPLLPDGFAADGEWQRAFAMTPNGEKLGFVVTKIPAGESELRQQLWISDGDGGNLKLLRSALPDTYFINREAANFSADGSSLIILKSAPNEASRLLKIPTDGVTAETVIFEADGGQSISRFMLSPDRTQVLLGVYDYASYGESYFLIDVASGQQHRLLSNVQGFYPTELAWAPNSKSLLIGAAQWSLGIPNSNTNDVRIYVFDIQGNQVKTFDTHVGAPTQGDYGGGQVGGAHWSSDGTEFFFSFTYCKDSCPPGLTVPAKPSTTPLVSFSKPTPTPSAGIGSTTVQLMGKLAGDMLLPIAATGSRYAASAWVPNERIIIGYDNVCNSSVHYRCPAAIFLDDNNRIQPLFADWYTAPDVSSNFYAGIGINDFLPNGRKMMFSSRRAALDRTSSCYDSGPDQYMVSSLQNLTADLRVLRDPALGGLVLRGTAADQNFYRYKIDYANLANPNDWKIVVPSSNSAVVDSVFTNWVPPSFGTFLLRLTVEDLAGNQRQQIRRVSWADTPSITDVYKDIDFFSPNGDHVQDEVKLHYRVLEPVHLEFSIHNKNNQLIRSVSRDHFSIGQEAFFTWDGRDERGQVAADGQYKISVQNFEFLITLDNTPPVATLELKNAFQPWLVDQGTPQAHTAVAFAPELIWNADDQNFNTMIIEYGLGEATDYLGAVHSYPQDPKKSRKFLGANSLVDVKYRITVTDRAGNQTQVAVPLADQQVFLSGWANYDPPLPPLPGRPGITDSSPIGVDYPAAQTIRQLPRIDGITGRIPVALAFVETVRKPLVKVILQYREVAHDDLSLPVSNLDSLTWTELPITNFIEYVPASVTNPAMWVNLSKLPQHLVSFLWDLKGLKPGIDYMVRLKVIDETDSEFFAISPYVFKLENQLGILEYEYPSQQVQVFSKDGDDFTFHAFTVDARAFWNEPINKIDLLIGSNEDSRFTTERVADTVFNPNGAYGHVVYGQPWLDLDLRPCTNYVLRLRAHLASGLIVFSEPFTAPSPCLGIEWVAQPETVLDCNTDPSEKIKITLKPYALDNRRLTQLLFGQILGDGREDILNNWNDVVAYKDNVFAINAQQSPVGKKRYFARLVNEDGQKVTVPIELDIVHQAPQADITYPHPGQKLCGTKVRDFFDPNKMINVVKVQGNIASVGPVSYALEYGKGANPSQWKVFSPISVPIVGTKDWYQGPRHQDPRPTVDPYHPHFWPGNPVSPADLAYCSYPDFPVCFDFHPVQWASPTFSYAYGFPGAPAQRGELGRLGLADKVEGEVSVRMRLFSPAGHQICTPPVTFEFDGQVKAQPSSIARTLFSPKADPSRNQVSLRVHPEETVTLLVQVLAGQATGDGKAVATGDVLRTLAANQVLEPGEAHFEWDGKADGDANLADGWYVLRVTYTDGCGNTLVQEHALELDATAPDVSISAPILNAQVGLIVPVVGAVRDVHFQSFVVQYQIPGNPDAWVTLASGDSATPAGETSQTLVDWNTLGLFGPVTLRVLAQDLAGNKTEKLLPLQVVARPNLIVQLEASPDLFSPNGDGQRDNTTIRYNLLSSAKVTLEVFRGSADGPLVQTLMRDETVAAGAGTKPWDGKNNLAQIEADGPLVVKLTATASGSAAYRQEAVASVVIDNTPPLLQLNYPKKDFVTAHGAVSLKTSDAHLLGFKAYFTNDPGTRQWPLLLEGTQEQTAATITNLEGLPDGKYGVKLQAQDKAGNATEFTKIFEVDNTPPKVTLMTPLAGSYLSAKKGWVNIVGAIEEKNLLNYKLRYGQGPVTPAFAELASGNSLPLPAILKAWDISQVPDGAYTLWLMAEDLAAQTGEAQVAVVVDNTPPIAIIVTPTNGSYVRQALDIIGTASDLNFKEYKLDIAPGNKATANRWSPLGSGSVAVNNGVLLKLQTLPPDGLQTLRLTVLDKAGNSSEALSELVIDTSPPTTPIGLTAKLEGRQNGRLNWNSNNETDLVGYALYRNGVRLNTVPLLETSFLDTGLASGNYVYQVKALDKAGWESAASNEAALTVSLTTPSAQISRPSNGAVVSGVIEVKGNATISNKSEFKEYRLYIGAGATPTDWQLLRRSPVPVQGDVLGNWNSFGLPENSLHTLKLEAEDLFGGSASDSVTISVDNTPPNAPLQLTATPNQSTVNLSWSASTSPDVIGYILSRDERIANAQGPVVGSLKPYLIVPTNYIDLNVADGRHRYVVQAMDRAENLSEPSNTAVVDIDTRPPHATIVKPLDHSKIGRNTYILANSPDTDIATVQFQYKAQGASNWVNLGAALDRLPYAVNWDNAALPFGVYQLQAIATDQTSHVDPAPTPITVSYVDQQAPDLVLALKAKVKGNDVTLTWQPSTEADIASYSLERVDASGQVQTLSATLAQAAGFLDVGLADGRYVYRVSAIDSTGNQGLASAPASALIYLPRLLQPYTPSSSATFALTGQAPLSGKMTLLGTDAQGGTSTTEFDSASDGHFEHADLALTLGDNRYSLIQTDVDGNQSRAALFHVRRANPPGAPSGLQAVTQARDVRLTWVANNEADILGYRVLRNGASDELLATGASASASSVASGNGFPYSGAELVLDGDFTTGWTPSQSQAQLSTMQWLQLRYPTPQTLSRFSINWGRTGVVQDYDFDAWDGEVWVTLAQVRANQASTVEVRLPQPYRSDRVRLRIVDAHSVVPKLLELGLFALPYQAETSLTLHDLAGVQQFAVMAENKYGMFSPATPLEYDTGRLAQPDLTVPQNSVVVTPAPISAGQASQLHAVVKNLGTGAASDFEVRFDVTDGHGALRTLARQNVNGLAIGSSRELVVDWTPTEAGDYTVNVIADAAGSVLESDETNNSASRVISVQAAPIPLAPIIVWPTVSGRPLVVNDPLTDIVGYAQAGLGITLLHDDAVVEQGVVAANVQSNTIALKNGWIDFDLSADGRSLLSVGPGLTITDVGSGNETTVPNAEQVRAARWSRDGKMIAFSRRDANTGFRSLYVYNNSAGSTQKVGEIRLGLDAMEWSPDGNTIAVIGSDGNSHRGLWLVNLTGGDARLLESGEFDESAGYTGYLAWSPDGQYLGAVQQYNYQRSSYVEVLRVSNGELIYSDPDDSRSYLRPSWSQDSTRLIYDFDDGSGTYRIEELTLGTDTRHTLSTGYTDPPSPSWLGLDDRWVNYENNSLVWRTHDGTLIQSLASGNIDRIKTTPSGYVVYQSNTHQLTRVSPPGTFRFAQQRLHVGRNQFAAWATNAVQQRSPNSAPIEVSLIAPVQPDLAASQADIVLLPSAPLVGETARMTLSIRNIGTSVARNFDVGVTARDPQGQITTLNSSTIASLAGGESTTVTLDWSPSVAGQYVIALALDASAVVLESNESNNVGVRTIEVATRALPTLAVSLDAQHYAANAPLHGTIRINNAGPQFSGSVALRIEDQDGYLVEALPAVTVLDLKYGESRDYPANWNTGTVLAGDYRLTAQLRDSKGDVVQNAHAGFTIDPARQVRATLLADRPQYKNGQDVSLAGTAELISANASLTDAVALIQIVNGNGETVFESSQALDTLLPGALARVSALWHLANRAPGAYLVTLRVNLGAQTLAQADTSFEVVIDNVAQLSGSLRLSGATLANGDRLSASYSLQNTGNVEMIALPVMVNIIDPDNQAVIASVRSSADLPVGGKADAQAAFDLNNWPLKPLQAVLSVELLGKTVILQRATLRVIDRAPPVVKFISPSPMALLGGAETAVVVKAIDLESRVTSVEAMIDGAAWKPMTLQSLANGLYNVKLLGLADGVHTVLARATDAFNNTSEPVTLDFVIDNTPPGIKVSGVVNNGNYSAPVTPVISITDAHRIVSSSILLDGVPFVSKQSVSQSGPHQLVIKASDEVGNNSALTLNFTLTPVVLNVSGGVGVASNEMAVGAEQVFYQKVFNASNAAMQAMKVKLTVTDAASNLVVYQNTDTIDDLAIEALWESERRWKVIGPAGSRYVVSLEVSVGDQSAVLEGVQFSAVAANPKLDISFAAATPQRLLVLAQCKRKVAANLGRCGIQALEFDDPAQLAQCDSERAAAVGRMLTSFGVANRVVSNETDFARELKRGGYSGYWLSGGGTKLQQPLQSELKVGLRLGETLLADGLHDVRDTDKALSELLNIQYRGQFAAGKTPIMTTLGDLYPAGNFDVLGDVLAVDVLSGGRAQAQFQDTGYTLDADKDSDCGKPLQVVTPPVTTVLACYADASAAAKPSGIASSLYGAGRTLFFAFDWVNTVTAQSSNPRWSEVGRNSFNWLQAAAADADLPLIAGDIVTRKAHLRNPGADTVLIVSAALPVGFTALASDPAAQIQTLPGGSIATWQLPLASGAERDLNLRLKLPGAAGNYDLLYSVKIVSDGKESLYSTDKIPVQVAGLASMLLDAKNAIGDLTLNGDNMANQADALRWIERAERSSAVGSNAQALRELIMAQSRLDRISGVDLSGAQRAVARLVRTLERRMVAD